MRLLNDLAVRLVAVGKIQHGFAILPDANGGLLHHGQLPYPLAEQQPRAVYDSAAAFGHVLPKLVKLTRADTGTGKDRQLFFGL